MRIGIDGGCWNNQRGYGRFLRELLGAVARQDGRNQYIVFLDDAAHASFDLVEPFQARLVPTSRTVAESAVADGSRSIGDLLRMSRAVARERLDVFFFPSVFSYFPLFRQVPVLLGIHDTIADQNPQFAFASKRQELMWRAKVRIAIWQATRVLTVSEYSKRSIIEVLHVPAEHIRIVREAASGHFRKFAVEPSPFPFILYVGGISPNKNLATLVRAYAQTDYRRHGAKLVLVGDYQNDGFKSSYQELKELIAQLQLGDQVIFKGFVSEDELVRLYNQCTAFVLPSFDEGFGLPVIEAMSCGAPVIVASGHAAEEVGGDAAVRIDPRDERSLALAMDAFMQDPQLREAYRSKALERAREFSWDTAAEGLIRCFEEMPHGAAR